MTENKPILCIDFDGVIHSYEKGWQGETIYGHIMPGFFEWTLKAKNIFKLTIYSSRSKDPILLNAMRDWMHEKYAEWAKANNYDTKEILDSEKYLIPIEFAHEKPPAFLTIDDRAIQFRGEWNSPELNPEILRRFLPWNVNTS